MISATLALNRLKVGGMGLSVVKRSLGLSLASRYSCCRFNSSMAAAGSHGTTMRKQVTVDRELPDIGKEKRHVRASLIGFSILMAATFMAIVKYEEINAPVVSSTLYTLRRSKTGREVLGENITFSAFIPWIYGKLQAGRGIVDFSYYVKGDNGEGLVHFDARRSRELNRFVVIDWSIEKEGVKYSLLDEEFHPFVPGAKEEATMRRR